MKLKKLLKVVPEYIHIYVIDIEAPYGLSYKVPRKEFEDGLLKDSKQLKVITAEPWSDQDGRACLLLGIKGLDFNLVKEVKV